MKMKVPSFDLSKQNQQLYEEIMEAIGSLIKSGQFILGPDLVKLEDDLNKRCGTRYAYGVSSGTDALYLSLLAADIGPGDEVITTPFTFIASASSVIHAGAKPVFCDIDPKTFNIDVNQIEELITENTKAILPVHLYGQVANMEKIKEIAQKYDLLVIEDAAQALGATYKDRPACSFGDLACLSFYPTKNLGAFGEAGMVLTNNEKFAQNVKL
ncbi:MAG: DegT/DnrJ/EryC1/StrS family aminotransferase, partial [Firmicutes bacterium]|nr:DegT/DnrJ/EryC1/StrS family aminotransferase [Bacillota bacterium]